MTKPLSLFSGAIELTRTMRKCTLTSALFIWTQVIEDDPRTERALEVA